MGPRFCKRGNEPVLTFVRCTWMLQWGHAFVSVETRMAHTSSLVRLVASMGPRFCKRGNRYQRISGCPPQQASMGPRFCKRGNSAPTARIATRRLMLQWGHAFVSVETYWFAVSGSVPSKLQWGHAFVSVETASRTVEQVYHLSSPLRPEAMRQAHILAG